MLVLGVAGGRANIHRPAMIGGTSMARAFWTGSLSFGLVEVPVRLTPATTSESIGFTLLDRKDLSPVGYRRYNKNTGDEVAWERIVRGYEYEKGEFVVLNDEDFERANVKAT